MLTACRKCRSWVHHQVVPTGQLPVWSCWDMELTSSVVAMGAIAPGMYVYVWEFGKSEVFYFCSATCVVNYRSQQSVCRIWLVKPWRTVLC